MGYEPLYHARKLRRVKPEVFLKHSVCSYKVKLEDLVKQLFHSRVGYEVIKTNSALRASLAIYHLISNTRLFIIMYESSFFWPRISYKVDTSPQTHFPVYCDHKANGLNPEIENI